MLQKLQLAQNEIHNDPVDIQSQKQEHQIFETELLANAGKIQPVVNLDLVQTEKTCTVQGSHGQNRLESLAEKVGPVIENEGDQHEKSIQCCRQVF